MSGTTLVAVAQRAAARLFIHSGPGEGLAEILDLTHPESRAHGRDLDVERPGRVQNRHGPARQALSPEQTHKEREAADFAREVAAAILDRRTHDGFDHLVLVAEPGFLGMLRDSLDGPTAAMIGGEVHKNLTKHTVEEIAEHLEHLLIP